MSNSVFLDLGNIVDKDFYIKFSIGDKPIEFRWKESKIKDLLRFIERIDLSGESDMEKEVEAEKAIFDFLHGINPEFSKNDYDALTPEHKASILEIIVKPIFNRPGHGVKKNKRPRKTLVLD